MSFQRCNEWNTWLARLLGSKGAVLAFAARSPLDTHKVSHVTWQQASEKQRCEAQLQQNCEIHDLMARQQKAAKYPSIHSILHSYSFFRVTSSCSQIGIRIHTVQYVFPMDCQGVSHSSAVLSIFSHQNFHCRPRNHSLENDSGICSICMRSFRTLLCQTASRIKKSTKNTTTWRSSEFWGLLSSSVFASSLFFAR